MSGELDGIIDRVRALGRFPEELAATAAPGVEAAVKATAAAGTTPAGKPWAPKKDGTSPLTNAAAAVHARAVGTVIELRLDGTSTGSQKVQAIQNTRRNILPPKGEGVPAPIVKAISDAAAKTFSRITGDR